MQFQQLTASGLISQGKGKIRGVFVSSGTPTIKIVNGIDAGNSSGTAATGTLSTTGVFSDGETVVVGGITYTFRTALTTSPSTVPNEVLIGVSASVSLDNLKAAVNAAAGIGTTYSTGTVVNPLVVAGTKTASSLVFTYVAVGEVGNSSATTETAANASFGGTTLTGGLNANTTIIDTFTAASATHYEFDHEGLDFTQGCYLILGGSGSISVSYEFDTL